MLKNGEFKVVFKNLKNTFKGLNKVVSCKRIVG